MCERLLAEHVDPGVECGGHVLLVEPVRRRDDHGVDPLAEQRVERVERRDAELPFVLHACRPGDVHAAREVDPVLEGALGVPDADTAQTDDPGRRFSVSLFIGIRARGIEESFIVVVSREKSEEGTRR